MGGVVMQYLLLAFVLVLVFLVITNSDQVKKALNALSAANVGAIVAFQGGNPSRFVNS